MSPNPRTDPPAGRRPGVAAVELAVCLPLLSLMLVGVWEVGRMVQVQQLLSNAVREGGRLASIGTKTTDDVQTAVVNYLKANGISNVKKSDVTFQNITMPSRTDPTQAEQMDQLRVSVAVSYDNVRWSMVPQITKINTL